MSNPPEPLRIAMTVEQLWQPVPGGSGTYIRGLASALSTRDDVAVTGVRARPAGTDRPAARELPVEVVASRLPRRILYEAWHRLHRPRLPKPAAMRTAGLEYDVIHATTWAIPPRSAPMVVTVHDVAFLRSPEHFTPHGVAFFTRALDLVRNLADVVVVPSETTRLDCLDAGVPEDRLRVIHHGTDACTATDDEVAAFRRVHGLDRDFVLWCGTFEPRKNLPVLLSAFEEALAAGADLDLVLVGPEGWGGVSEEVRRTVDALPAERVHQLGRLDDHDLQLAYAGARVFCFPSLWEGFGMPVLEAMNHGTPVVTSRATSMAEISGDGALLIDPHSPSEIAEALMRAAGPEHARLAAASRANAARYTWQASADKHRAAYRDAIENARPVKGRAS